MGAPVNTQSIGNPADDSTPEPTKVDAAAATDTVPQGSAGVKDEQIHTDDPSTANDDPHAISKGETQSFLTHPAILQIVQEPSMLLLVMSMYMSLAIDMEIGNVITEMVTNNLHKLMANLSHFSVARKHLCDFIRSDPMRAFSRVYSSLSHHLRMKRPQTATLTDVVEFSLEQFGGRARVFTWALNVMSTLVLPSSWSSNGSRIASTTWRVLKFVCIFIICCKLTFFIVLMLANMFFAAPHSTLSGVAQELWNNFLLLMDTGTWLYKAGVLFFTILSMVGIGLAFIAILVVVFLFVGSVFTFFVHAYGAICTVRMNRITSTINLLIIVVGTWGFFFFASLFFPIRYLFNRLMAWFSGESANSIDLGIIREFGRFTGDHFKYIEDELVRHSSGGDDIRILTKKALKQSAAEADAETVLAAIDSLVVTAFMNILGDPVKRDEITKKMKMLNYAFKLDFDDPSHQKK